MSETFFPDPERQLLVVLVTHAMVRISDDPAMIEHYNELISILKKIEGVDTQLISRRS